MFNYLFYNCDSNLKLLNFKEFLQFLRFKNNKLKIENNMNI
jgi:hypothetical protein